MWGHFPPGLVLGAERPWKTQGKQSNLNVGQMSKDVTQRNSKNRALNTDHQSEVQTPPGSSVFALAKAGRLPGRERETHTHPSRWVA